MDELRLRRRGSRGLARDLARRGGGLRRLQREGVGGPGHGEDEGDGRQGNVGQRAEAGHGNLLQEEIHPLPEVALAKEGRGRDRARVSGEPRHLDERLEIGLTVAEVVDDRGVHGLLAREADAGDQPVDGRVEEEDGLQRLLGHQHRPVGAAGVDELVQGDGRLALARHRLEDRGQQDDRAPQAERGGSAGRVGEEEAGARRHAVAQSQEPRRRVQRS